MIYKVSLSRKSKMLTALFILLLLGAAYPLFSKASTETVMWKLLLECVGIVALSGVVIMSYLKSIRHYRIDNDQIVIKRQIGEAYVDLNEIKKVFLAPGNPMGELKKEIASQGMFGYYGRFYSSTFGAMRWYATRNRDFLMLERFDEEFIVLTPDDNIAMFDDIKKVISTLPPIEIEPDDSDLIGE